MEHVCCLLVAMSLKSLSLSLQYFNILIIRTKVSQKRAKKGQKRLLVLIVSKYSKKGQIGQTKAKNDQKGQKLTFHLKMPKGAKKCQKSAKMAKKNLLPLEDELLED